MAPVCPERILHCVFHHIFLYILPKGEHVGGAVVAKVISVKGVEKFVPELCAVPVLEPLAGSEHDLDVGQPEVDVAVAGVVEHLLREDLVGKVNVLLDQLRQSGVVLVVEVPQGFINA